MTRFLLYSNGGKCIILVIRIITVPLWKMHKVMSEAKPYKIQETSEKRVDDPVIMG